MKTLSLIGMLLLLPCSAFSKSEYQFMDDAPTGFIHFVYPNENSKLANEDAYIATSDIVKITIEEEKDDDGSPISYNVTIKTNGSSSYQLDFPTKEKALGFARRIMQLSKN